jgi:prepilin-type N-terminal cleavage/methylation domain-containing protein
MLTAAEGRVRGGFTLIEVVTALAIGGLALSIASALLSATSSQMALAAERADTADAARNSERLLRRLVGQMDFARGGDLPSLGTGEHLRFMSWCEVPGGWQERCSVDLTLPPLGDTIGGIEARLSTGERYRLLRGRSVHRILLLGRIERGIIWVERWDGTGTLPEAIGIALMNDTLFIRSGDRS